VSTKRNYREGIGIAHLSLFGSKARGDDSAQSYVDLMAAFDPGRKFSTLRRALGLTQEEFSARYRIPLGTLRDWEQGRCEPDAPSRAYLMVIAHNPGGVAAVLAGRDGR